MRRLIDWSDARRAAKTARILQPWVRGRTLDVGCWDGRVVKQLGVDATGIDVCDPPFPQIPVVRFDGTVIPFETGTFDTVLCCTALHHAVDQPGLFREMLRVGKRVVLFEDSFDTFFERTSVILLHEMSSRMLSMPYRRNGFHSLEEWKRFFAEFPCRLTSVNRYPGIMPIWFYLRHYLFELEPERSSA